MAQDEGLFNTGALRDWYNAGATRDLSIPGGQPGNSLSGPPRTPAAQPNAPVINSPAPPPPAPRPPSGRGSALPPDVDRRIDDIAKRIAGVQRFDYSQKAPAGGVVANGALSDWSPGSRQASALDTASGLNVRPGAFTGYSAQAVSDEFGRPLPDRQVVTPIGTMSNRADAGLTYDEQVARAAKINDMTMRSLATLTPKEAAEAGILEAQRVAAGSGKRRKPGKDFNPVAMANAAAGVAGAASRIKALEGGFADKQALALGDQREAGDRYKADQQLAGQKALADANISATKMQVDADKQKTKDTLALTERTAKDQRRSDMLKMYEANMKALTSSEAMLMPPEQRAALEQETSALRGALTADLSPAEAKSGKRTGKIDHKDPRVQKAIKAGYSEQEIAEFLDGRR